MVQYLSANRTVELNSTDGWRSVTIMHEQASTPSMPTVAVTVGTYVFNLRLDTLFDPAAAMVGNYLLQQF
ncbi:hypothetical protein [Pseudotabrizicola sp. 4114]|uniref:hypothetical protein n=1 Tax=Pseudotabrizicola sp. 4114 TaxID=2817731 RepID=UPI0028610081|nr:hypothetical protein [Pseudorhodobacter sp. 4114]